MKRKVNFKNGEIYWAYLRNYEGSIQGGIRPVIIVQNPLACKYSPIVLVVPLTSKMKKILPTHFQLLKKDHAHLKQDSVILAEQIMPITREQLICPLNETLGMEELNELHHCLKVALGMIQVA